MADPIEPGHAGPPPGFSARCARRCTPDVSGSWQFGISSVADAALSIDGKAVVDNHGVSPGGSFFGIGKAEQIGTVDLEAGRQYQLEVRMRRPASHNAAQRNQHRCPPPDRRRPDARRHRTGRCIRRRSRGRRHQRRLGERGLRPRQHGPARPPGRARSAVWPRCATARSSWSTPAHRWRCHGSTRSRR